MAISVVCACGKVLQVKDDMAGRRGKCPACGQVVEIGQADGTASDASPAGGDDPFGLGSPAGSTPGGAFGGAGFGSAFGGPAATGGAFGGSAFGGAPLGGPQLAGRPPAGGQASSPEKPFFLRLHVLAIGLCVIVLLVVASLFLFFREDPPAVATPSAPVAPAAPEKPAVVVPPFRIVRADLNELEPGRTAIAVVEIDRGEITQSGETTDPSESPEASETAVPSGTNEPSVPGETIHVFVEDLPGKVTVTPVDLPAGKKSVELVFTAAADAAEGQFTVKVVARLGEQPVTQSVPLTIRKVPPPSVLPLALVSLPPGDRAVADVVLERNGHEGPIQVQVTGLPAKITATPLTIAADQNAGKLELLAAADAVEGKATAKLVATVADRTGETSLQLSIEKYPFRILPLASPVVWTDGKQTASVEVKVQRRSHQGPIEVQVAGLPALVTAAPLTIPAGQTTGTLVLTTADDAVDRVRSAKLVTPTDPTAPPQALIVRVKQGAGSLLPEVNIRPELASLLKRGSFGGRLTSESKQALMEIYGGTPESEAAVLAGLRWLAAHQAEDGHWSMEAYKGESDCDCKIEAEAEVPTNNTAATAFGLLPFLGAGITPQRAPDKPEELATFKETVRKGLHYLVANQKTTNTYTNGDLGGGMYAHALGTIALCEAYGLTKHDHLKVPAQKAVRYLMQAQHVQTGGWGYGPRREGDTSVLGWVFLAIRSGQLAGIPFEQAVLDRAGRFLNSTAAGPEPHLLSRYAYKPEGKGTLALTAAGLLSRQYLGWQHTRAELAEGCNYLMTSLPPESGAALGPSYYYYYATQVLHHMEGKNWDLWNHRIREHLIKQQEQSGHKAGSWSPQGCDYGPRGGRLYATSMSLLTLQVYYRHLPLYRKIEFPTETAAK